MGRPAGENGLRKGHWASLFQRSENGSKAARGKRTHKKIKRGGWGTGSLGDGL